MNLESEDHHTNEELPSIEPLPEISFHAMARTNHPQTLRMTGKIRNKEVTVLIDGGSTHNFINWLIVNKLMLPIVCDRSFQVMVGNCEKIECPRRCLNLALIIQDHTIVADFYILLAIACQVVLGIQWLDSRSSRNRLSQVDNDFHSQRSVAPASWFGSSQLWALRQ